MRVLIADDNAAFRAVLQAMLVSWGYDVSAAADGNEAWRILQSENSPRLAILDWMMPGMDGIEICRRVRATHCPAVYIYILMLTSKTGSEDLVEALESGADDYAQKPFKSLELRARLRAAQRILHLQEQLQQVMPQYGYAGDKIGESLKPPVESTCITEISKC